MEQEHIPIPLPIAGLVGQDARCSKEVRHEVTAFFAKLFWERRGKPEGRDDQNWADAEAFVDRYWALWLGDVEIAYYAVRQRDKILASGESRL